MINRNQEFKKRICKRLLERKMQKLKERIESNNQDIIWLEAENEKKKETNGEETDREGTGDQGFLTKED